MLMVDYVNAVIELRDAEHLEGQHRRIEDVFQAKCEEE